MEVELKKPSKLRKVKSHHVHLCTLQSKQKGKALLLLRRTIETIEQKQQKSHPKRKRNKKVARKLLIIDKKPAWNLARKDNQKEQKSLHMTLWHHCDRSDTFRIMTIDWGFVWNYIGFSFGVPLVVAVGGAMGVKYCLCRHPPARRTLRLNTWRHSASPRRRKNVRAIN